MKRRKNIATSEAGFVFKPATGDSFAANPLAAGIIAQLKAGHEVTANKADLLGRYEVSVSQLQRDFDGLLTQLAQHQLVQDPSTNAYPHCRPPPAARPPWPSPASTPPAAPARAWPWRGPCAKALTTRCLIGLSYEALEPGIYLRELFKKIYQLPYPAAGSAALLERLEYIQTQEKLDVLTPNFDAELPLFSRLAPRLRALGINIFLPTLPQLEARDKLNLSAFGAAHDLAVPATEVLPHAAAAAAALG